MKKLSILLLCIALLCTTARTDGGQPAERYVALTFDDGPNGKVTEQLLDGLKERYVSATFFLCGYRLEEYPELAGRIAAEGHEVGVHGWSHTYLHTAAREQIRDELGRTAARVEELTGTRPKLFRPPGGLCSGALLEEAEQEGFSAILWSIDPQDWNTHDADAVYRRIMKKVGDGDIILMHDLNRSSVNAALRLIDELEAQGYCFCTVSELAEVRGMELAAGEKYYKFPDLGEG